MLCSFPVWQWLRDAREPPSLMTPSSASPPGSAQGDAVEIEDLFVDPEWMRQGIGRALVLDLLAIARGRGARRVEVTANQHALAFYENAGFTVSHDVETRFGQAPRMQRDGTP